MMKRYCRVSANGERQLPEGAVKKYMHAANRRGGGANISYKPIKRGFGYSPTTLSLALYVATFLNTMGSSQSRHNETNRHSRVGDQLKTALRKPGPSAQENNNNGDDEKPQSAGVSEHGVTNGNHDDTISTPETGQKRASTAVCSYKLYVAVLS